MGLTEVILVVIILVLVFGANKLPAIGNALGRTVKSFKRGTRENDEIAVKKRREERLSEPEPEPDDEPKS